MDVLVIGGTKFVGRHLVEAALARGHRTTLFHRGRTNEDLFPEAEHVHGDRDGDLPELNGRRFDAVLDSSGYVPRVVRRSAEAFAGRTDRYLYISTLSVYANETTPGQDEQASLATIPDPTTEIVDGETYGALKALCEGEVARTIGEDRTLTIRCGYVIGPHDHTDRFPSWIRRVAAGGEMLAPGPRDNPFQAIDARDLGTWCIRLVEEGRSGTFNATAPRKPYTFEEVLQTARDVSGAATDLIWVDEAFLEERGAAGELPLWHPGSRGVMEVDVSRALDAGLAPRPLAETIEATLSWDRQRRSGDGPRLGLGPERERELLAAWTARKEAT